jgi:hypothetical protein
MTKIETAPVKAALLERQPDEPKFLHQFTSAIEHEEGGTVRGRLLRALARFTEPGYHDGRTDIIKRRWLLHEAWSEDVDASQRAGVEASVSVWFSNGHVSQLARNGPTEEQAIAKLEASLEGALADEGDDPLMDAAVECLTGTPPWRL